MDHQTKVDPTHDPTHTPTLSKSPIPYIPPSLYITTFLYRTFLQLNKCGALLNGPHISPAAAAAPAAAASDPVTNAPQKLLKWPLNLFQSSRKQKMKRGNGLEVKTFSNDGCHLVMLDSSLIGLYWLTKYQHPPSYVLGTQYTTITQLNLSTIEQVRSTIKWASLFSCCCFRSWHKCSSNAL